MATRKIWAILAGLFSVVILLIPDMLPVIDEAGAALVLIWAIKELFGKGGGPPPGSGSKPPEKTVH
jgi:hypothetical protein